MTIFSRNIAVDIDEGRPGMLVVKSRMVDRSHDITVTLDVSLPRYTIVDVGVDMAIVPSEHCRLIYPIAKRLVGLSIAKGFNRSVVGILAGAQGCSNVLNLVLVAAPLAINASYMMGDRGEGTGDRPQAPVPRPPRRPPADDYLEGTCIAHP